jgi:hypothetical protein
MAYQTFIFNGLTKHGVHAFMPGIVLGFEDVDAVPYFKACGWGEQGDDNDPAAVHVYTIGEVDIDPLTVHRATGLLVSDIVHNGGTPEAAVAAGVQPHSNPGELSVDHFTNETVTGA